MVAVFAIFMFVLAGCGGGNGGTAPNPDAPLISNLSVRRLQSCTVQGLSGTAQMITVDYADINGDISGGQIEVELRSGDRTIDTLSIAVPSGAASVTGTTSGQVNVGVCVAIVGLFGSLEGEARVKLIDAAGNRSNRLSATVQGRTRASEAPGSESGSPRGAMMKFRR